MVRLFSCFTLAAMVSLPALAEVTVCHGATNCQTVSPGATRQWSQEDSVAKFMREAREKIYDAQSACRYADDPQACREAAQTLVQTLSRTK